MTWVLIVGMFVIIMLLGAVVPNAVLRRRARARHKVLLTPEQRQEAFYQTWKPKIAESKGPQEFYDVEREGL